MSHITKYIERELSTLSTKDIIDIYLSVYTETIEEDKAQIMSTLHLTYNFYNGAYTEDENSYILVFIPATANTLIIKKEQK